MVDKEAEIKLVKDRLENINEIFRTKNRNR